MLVIHPSWISKLPSVSLNSIIFNSSGLYCIIFCSYCKGELSLKASSVFENLYLFILILVFIQFEINKVILNWMYSILNLSLPEHLIFLYELLHRFLQTNCLSKYCFDFCVPIQYTRGILSNRLTSRTCN